MEAKRKNVYIVIFIITTIIASVTAIYFGVFNSKEKESLEKELAEKNKNYDEKISSLNAQIDTYKKEIDTKNKDKDTSELETKTSLTQEEIDKIAHVTMQEFYTVDEAMMVSTDGGFLSNKYLGFYKTAGDVSKNITIVKDANGLQMQKTNIKYDDFIKKLKSYMSENLTKVYDGKIIKNVDGYLTIIGGGASGAESYVEDVKLISKNNDEYTYEANIVTVSLNYRVSRETKKFNMKKIDGKYVITGPEDVGHFQNN